MIGDFVLRNDDGTETRLIDARRSVTIHSDPIAAQNARMTEALSLAWDRLFVADMPTPTEEQRAEWRAAYERRQQELRDRIAAKKRERQDRHAAVLAYFPGLLARVVAHHRPMNDGDCGGCDQFSDNEPADWPCSTFLMIEQEVP